MGFPMFEYLVLWTKMVHVAVTAWLVLVEVRCLCRYFDTPERATRQRGYILALCAAAFLLWMEG